MASKKKVQRDDERGNGRSRAPRSKKRTTGPTPHELASATRTLARYLNAAVKILNEGNEDPDRDASGDVATWSAEVAPWLRNVPGVLQAVIAYAERNALEQRRLWRAIGLSDLALRLARGEILAVDAIRQAEGLRGDNALVEGTTGELREAVDRATTERTKWRAAYTVLAFDADVWPVPDTGRRWGGDLEKLYETSVLEASRRDQPGTIVRRRY